MSVVLFGVCFTFRKELQVLSWFILLMVMGYRMAAIRVMGRNVMRPKGLVGLSKDSLQFCQSEILQVNLSVVSHWLNTEYPQ